MHLTTYLIALHIFGTLPPSPSWNRDYAAAMKRAATENKPVAVVVASGKDGWKKVCLGEKLDREVRRLLAEHYVCVYIDASEPGTRELVKAFEAGRQPLLVLSARNLVHQAYRHAGELANDSLVEVVRRHASAEAPSQTVAPAATPDMVPCGT
jgi:hypothetical protein